MIYLDLALDLYLPIDDGLTTSKGNVSELYIRNEW